MNKNKGFTLIELLVVISIIAMLSSVVLSALGSAKGKGNDSAKIQSLRQVQTALAMYYNDFGSYASSTTLLTVATSKNNNKPYIPTILTGIKYTALKDKTTGVTCTAANEKCAFYHLAITLSDRTLTVLKNDANSSKIGTSDIINGKADDCVSSTDVTAGTYSLCYDLTPDKN